MPELELHQSYNRKEIHDIFAPETRFTPQAGTWGLQGIVELSERPGDFVFFVTFGRREGDHDFDEGISTDGILRWQSQPKQSLLDTTILRLIAHDERVNNIHLFLRTKERESGARADYTYLGVLRYGTHDNQRERPVHFDWQLLSWPIPPEVLARTGLRLEQPLSAAQTTATPAPEPPGGTAMLVLDPQVPDQGPRRGVATSGFTRRYLGDYAERERTNRSLGLAGEKLVVEYERERLRGLGQIDLAAKVRHVAAEEGDGAGYDVLSFSESGAPIYIEVKTTRGPKTTEFFLTPNEVAFSRVHADHYELRRVYGYDARSPSCRFYSLHGSLDGQFVLTPTEFKVSGLTTSATG